MDAWFWWALAAIVFFAGEILTTGFFLLGAGLGALVGMVFSFFLPLPFQMLAFVVSTGGLVVASRPLYKRWLANNGSQPKVASNVDAMIDQVGVVVKAIDNRNGGGLVKVNGEDWSALSENDEVIESDTQVLVVGVQGVKLVVMAQT